MSDDILLEEFKSLKNWKKIRDFSQRERSRPIVPTNYNTVAASIDIADFNIYCMEHIKKIKKTLVSTLIM